MIIKIKDGIINDIDRYKQVKIDHFIIYWRGVFFIRGNKEGKDSIEQLAKMLINKQTTINHTPFCGAYICIIHNTLSNTYCVFSDNNSLNCFYVSDDYITDDYLLLLKANNTNKFDYNAIAEYLIYGQCFFNKTLVKGLQLSDVDKEYVIENGELTIRSKVLKSIDEPPEINSHKQLFEDIAYALSDQKISLALTGGYDSRYVLSLLNRLDINTCISGDNLDNNDIKLSAEVAKAANKKNEIIIINKPAVNDAYYRKMFEDFSGIPIGFTDSSVRLYEFLKKRGKEYDIHLTGDTGVLHKGENWIMDFPRYRKKKFNVNIYYKLLILSVKNTDPLSLEILTLHKDNEKAIIRWLEDNKKETNTKSYDYYDIKTAFEFNRRQLGMGECNFVNIYCPLMEMEAIRYSYHLQRRKRYRATAMKEVVTQFNKKVARIPTTTGTTVSSELTYRIRDYIIDIRNIMIKALRLAGRICLKKTYFIGNVLTWSNENEFRKLEIVNKAVSFAKSNRIIDDNCSERDLSYSLLSKLLELYLISEYGSIKNDSSNEIEKML